MTFFLFGKVDNKTLEKCTIKLWKSDNVLVKGIK